MALAQALAPSSLLLLPPPLLPSLPLETLELNQHHVIREEAMMMIITAISTNPRLTSLKVNMGERAGLVLLQSLHHGKWPKLESLHIDIEPSVDSSSSSSSSSSVCIASVLALALGACNSSSSSSSSSSSRLKQLSVRCGSSIQGFSALALVLSQGACRHLEKLWVYPIIPTGSGSSSGTTTTTSSTITTTGSSRRACLRDLQQCMQGPAITVIPWTSCGDYHEDDV